MNYRFSFVCDNSRPDPPYSPWGVAGNIIWAWILTLPAAGIVAYASVKLFRLFGWIP